MHKDLSLTAPSLPGAESGGGLGVHYSNKTKVLLCYLLAWGFVLLAVLVGLAWVYPYQLAGTAPNIAENLAASFPFLASPLESSRQAAAIGDGAGAAAVSLALSARDGAWRMFVASTIGACWVLSLLGQLGWRFAYRRPLLVAQATRRAVHTYRLVFLSIVALNLLGALAVYLLGMRFVEGKTLWDWLIDMGGFGLNGFAAWLCFRMAAPPAISGKGAFFKRL